MHVYSDRLLKLNVFVRDNLDFFFQKSHCMEIQLFSITIQVAMYRYILYNYIPKIISLATPEWPIPLYGFLTEHV